MDVQVERGGKNRKLFQAFSSISNQYFFTKEAHEAWVIDIEEGTYRELRRSLGWMGTVWKMVFQKNHYVKFYFLFRLKSRQKSSLLDYPFLLDPTSKVRWNITLPVLKDLFSWFLCVCVFWFIFCPKMWLLNSNDFQERENLMEVYSNQFPSERFSSE